MRGAHDKCCLPLSVTAVLLGVTDVASAGTRSPSGRQLQIRDFVTQQLLASFHMPGHVITKALFDGTKFIM